MVEWNVYYHEFNGDKIKTYNIFKHGKFVEYIKKHKKKCETKEEFAEKLRRELFYYFGSKCEWELIVTLNNNRIVLTPWIGRKENVSLDVTDDECFDWSGFYNWMTKQVYTDENGSMKVDVYSQVMYNFDKFVDYCWGVKRWITSRYD